MHSREDKKNALHSLPWWGDVIHNNPGHYEFFDCRFAKELTSRVQQAPLSRAYLEAFVNEHVEKVRLFNYSHSHDTGKIETIGDCKFIVSMNGNVPLVNLASTFLHELIHGVYRAQGHKEPIYAERIVLQMEKKFFEKNKRFCMTMLYKNIPENYIAERFGD